MFMVLHMVYRVVYGCKFDLSTGNRILALVIMKTILYIVYVHL